ncbi:hypothetical protein EGT74_10880 [Chitinophaga lutea]|uniref:Uncharacterized protein n=1 Tax=Chitinophaga lutea TaxID=2488634 RepID=A0A3N4QDE5_9BACT|nr:outer membrane beta-barrel protein [Chitinophaga lutea]RPE13987.1 hypothetical protein EGT74_10880 [Chitinophaga lutea]
MKVIRYAIILMLLATTTGLRAQEDSSAPKKRVSYHFHFYAPAKPRTGYITAGGNGPLLSFANVDKAGEHVRNIPRFTVFFNVGTNYNYDFTNNFGIFSGLNIKNIGLITKPNDSVKLKQRVYTLGVPLGLKFGNMRNGFFFFMGGEYDLAFNYKEKFFLHGDKKSKFNEWFSDRTPLLMPSVFAGFRFSPGFGLKVQYYLNDFYNKDYTQTVNGVKEQPYKDLKAKMMFVTLSYNFGVRWETDRYHKRHHDKYRKGTKVIIEKKTVTD